MAAPLVRTASIWLRGDFSSPVATWHAFLEAVNRLPGITVLATCWHQFPGGGLSGVVVIGESHAAIHTWPEHDRAWVELATCGDPAALIRFPAEMARAGWTVVSAGDDAEE